MKSAKPLSDIGFKHFIKRLPDTFAEKHSTEGLVTVHDRNTAQNDAGVGVKNGINAFGRKNFLGTFAPPFAVINDFAFLDTLPQRDLRAGIVEAVKVALIKDKDFFAFLYRERRRLATFAPPLMEKMIRRCAELHLEHITTQGDPFEFGSARPLDFGHWSAHKLEELTAGRLNHGEAVTVGIALDSLYASHLAMIQPAELDMILATLEDLGLDLYHPALEMMDVDKALREFQEHLGGQLNITLLTSLGRKKEVHEIDLSLMRRCLGLLRARHLSNKGRHELYHRTEPRLPQPAAAAAAAM
jgi:3-dehydroquinate synthase